MSKKLVVLARAVSRITPRMFAFQLRRMARNRLTGRFADAWVRLLRRVEAGVPPLAGAADRPLDLARAAADFYLEEYRPHMADAEAGRFEFFGHPVDFGAPGAIDWHVAIPEEGDHQLWRMKLGHIGFLCPMLVRGREAPAEAILAVLKSFPDDAASFRIPDCYMSLWFPYGVAHRILALTSGLIIGRAAGLPAEVDAAVVAFLRRQVAFMLVNIEHEFMNNHTERNLAALTLYYSHVERPPRAVVAMLERESRAILRATVLPDGLQIERSAMYMALTVMSLRIFALAPIFSAELRAEAGVARDRAEAAWAVLIHPDGDIALFNDSWLGEVPKAAELIGHAAPRRRVVLPDGGYGRLESSALMALLDAGPIGPRWNPAHGHADFLAMEVDVHAHRFLVDPGTSQYSTGPERAFERSAASHNGPRFLDREPVEYADCFKVGRMAAARPIAEERLAPLPAPTIGGALDLPDLGGLRRTVALLDDDTLLVVDRWIGATPGGTRLLVAGDWRMTARDDRGFVFEHDGRIARLTLVTGSLASVATSHWCRRYLRPEPATAIELVPVTNGGDARLVFAISAGDRMPAPPADTIEAMVAAAM